MYHVTVPANYTVLLTVNSFITELNYDKLYIYDGPNTASPLLAEWSGTVAAGTQVQSTGSAIMANFITDSSEIDIGFSISYSKLQTTLLTTSPPSISACLPSIYSTHDDLLLAPDFGTSQNYGSSTSCLYHITAPAGYTILLTVIIFMTEPNHDRLYIYDGSNTTSPLLAQWTGRVAAGRRLESSGNTLTAKFVTDGSGNRAFFAIRYSKQIPIGINPERLSSGKIGRTVVNLFSEPNQTQPTSRGGCRWFGEAPFCNRDCPDDYDLIREHNGRCHNGWFADDCIPDSSFGKSCSTIFDTKFRKRFCCRSDSSDCTWSGRWMDTNNAYMHCKYDYTVRPCGRLTCSTNHQNHFATSLIGGDNCNYLQMWGYSGKATCGYIAWYDITGELCYRWYKTARVGKYSDDYI
uniref:CUB domain-containing protein n=1 Tax=Plectus sambesii TaxID=2011161 RepID=A0A914W858_9BILA